jgi:hypothetical protein
MITTSGSTQSCINWLTENSSKIFLGDKLLQFIDHSVFLFNKIKKLAKFLFIWSQNIVINYVYPYGIIILTKLYRLHNELADNNRSGQVKNKLDNKYVGTKSYVVEKFVQPYVVKSFEDAMRNNPFDAQFNEQFNNQFNNQFNDLINDQINDQLNDQLSDQLNDQLSDQLNDQVEIQNADSCQDSLSNKGINMSFLSNTTMDDSADSLDDDLDVEVENMPMPEPVNPTETTQTNSSTSSASQTTAQPVKSDTIKDSVKESSKEPPVRIDNREMLRRKLAEKTAGKKAMRTGVIPRGNKAAKKNMATMMNMPGMNEMMETMFQGDNLEKIMKQIPQGGLGTKMPPIDPAQMKKVMQAMMNKN